MQCVMTSARDLKRVEVLAQVDDHSAPDAQTDFRLPKLYGQEGASPIRHKARAKPPNDRIHHAKRNVVLSLIKES